MTENDPTDQIGQIRLWSFICLASSLAIAVGSLAPWATVLTFSKGGTEGDGTITLVLGAIASVLSFILVARDGAALLGDRYILPLLALVVVVIAAYDIVSVGEVTFEVLSAEANPAVGWGLWFVMIGGLFLLSGSILTALKFEEY
ncbi:hypothetical protein CH286_03090 [Rhodococcus sp. WWJCD1]|uniref:hypothetical protein n=1 Tax=Rhodococcus sp. WWJCD1 TaxID=2022519 RepID=UPI000B9C5B93|nr:hypothetical protein [Rhodococcus sp. WWJCD1]OZC52564.1 hypothetical protein CH286_03090 [Rhodococcus sp. WWJCD1]